MAIDTIGANALASNSVTTAKISDDAVIVCPENIFSISDQMQDDGFPNFRNPVDQLAKQWVGHPNLKLQPLHFLAPPIQEVTRKRNLSSREWCTNPHLR